MVQLGLVGLDNGTIVGNGDWSVGAGAVVVGGIITASLTVTLMVEKTGGLNEVWSFCTNWTPRIWVPEPRLVQILVFDSLSL